MKPTNFLLWVVRGLFIILSLGVATSIALQGSSQVDASKIGAFGPWTPSLFFISVLTGVLAVIALDIFTRNKQITTLSAIYFGLMLGLLFGDLFSRAIDPIVNTEATKWVLTPLRILITLFFCYICVSTLFQTKDVTEKQGNQNPQRREDPFCCLGVDDGINGSRKEIAKEQTKH